MLAMVFICMCYWSGTNAALYNVYITAQAADFILRTQGTGWALFPAFYLLFLLHFMKKNRVLSSVYLYFFLTASSAYFIAGSFSNKMLTCCDSTYFGLTGIWKNTVFSWSFAVYCTVLFVFIIFMLVDFINKQKNSGYRESAKIILASTVVFFAVSLIISFVMKGLRVHVPVQANITMLIFVAGTVYAAEKYGFFEINAETAADKIVESIDEGLILTDTEGVVVQANKRAVSMMERLGNPEGKNIFELTGEKSFVTRVVSGEKIHAEVVRDTPVGKRVYTISAGPVEKKGERFGYVCVVNDITDRKKAEEELKLTIQELQRSNADLEQFANAAAHDLKEPARMVASHIQLLKKKSYEQMDGDRKEHMDFAVEGAFRMNSLINDLLDYAAIQSGAVKPSVLNLGLIIAGVTAGLKRKTDDAKAEITVSGSLPQIRGDEKQIARLLNNILDNAVKFRAPGVKPQIEISSRQDADSVYIMVKDNGIGIKEEYQNKIFDMFQRLNSREQYEGNGAGLAICRRIMERHGGKIWAESAGDGMGSTFVMEFKRAV